MSLIRTLLMKLSFPFALISWMRSLLEEPQDIFRGVNLESESSLGVHTEKQNWWTVAVIQ